MNTQLTSSKTARRPATLLKAASAAALLALAGCAQVLPVLPLSPDERQYEQSLQSAADNDAKVALGQLYFMHNDIDRADQVLKPVVAADPKNAQALAWYGANNCKLAGRRGPWLMGLDKLLMVRECLQQVDQALAMAPKDFVVQMVHMETGQAVDKFGSLDRAAATQKQVEGELAARPQALPADARAQFWVTAARIERKRGNTARATQLLEQAAKSASAPTTHESIVQERRLLAGG
jgi:uncharacterized protein HemY